MKRIVCCLLCTVLLLTCGCSRTASKEEGLDKLRVGYHQNFGGSSAVFIGVEKGYFREEGIDVELVGFNSGPPSIAALGAGDVDVTFIGHGAFSMVLEGQAEVIAVESLSNAEEILTRSDSGIRALSDLVGKRLATPFGTSGENFLDVALSANGIDRDMIDVVNMDVAGAVSALTHGYVDAVAIWAPYTNEIRSMLPSGSVVSLADCMDYRDEIALPMFWVSTHQEIVQNPELLTRFVRALYRCLDDRAADLDGAARLVSAQLGKSYDIILLDTTTAEWFTAESASDYLWSGTIESWVQTLADFFVQKGAVKAQDPQNSFLHLEFMRQVLPQLKEGGG